MIKRQTIIVLSIVILFGMASAAGCGQTAEEWLIKGDNAATPQGKIRCYTKAINLGSVDAETYCKRAQVYMSLEEYDMAVGDYTKAIELDPNNTEIYRKRAEAHISLAYYDKAVTEYGMAITDYTKIIGLDPNNAEAYKDRGISYDYLQKRNEAVADYTKAIKIDPNDAEAYYNRGLDLSILEKYDEAIVDYTKVIELNPNDYEAQHNRKDLLNIVAGLKAGTFLNKPEAILAIEEISELLIPEHRKIMDPKIIDCLITTEASLITDNAEWTNDGLAHAIYDLIKLCDDNTVVDDLVNKVRYNSKNRLHVLFLAVKLGIPGSEESLNEVLDEYGDRQMAEDFLNSGSLRLSEGGERWAKKHGYEILLLPGSNRMSWGEF